METHYFALRSDFSHRVAGGQALERRIINVESTKVISQLFKIIKRGAAVEMLLD